MFARGKSTCSRIVEAARCLFWLNGYGMTTVNEILARAEANPGSFYYLFKTKKNVLLAVLNNNSRALVPMIVNPILAKTADPIERVFGILDVYRQNLIASEFSCGCFVGKLALEIPEDQLHIHNRIAESFDNWTAAIEKCLEDARPRLPMDVNLQTLSKFVLTTMEGGVMQARAHKSIEPFDASFDHLWNYFRLLQLQRAWEKDIKEAQAPQKVRRNAQRRAKTRNKTTGTREAFGPLCRNTNDGRDVESQTSPGAGQV